MITVKNISELYADPQDGSFVRQCLTTDQLQGVGVDHVHIPKGCSLNPHYHDQAETFIIIIEGSASVRLDDKENVKVTKGDLIHVPAGAIHGFSTPDESVTLISVQSPSIYLDNGEADINFI